MSLIVSMCREVARVLREGGLLVTVANTPEFYRGHWVSNGVDFPENQAPLVSGQEVKVKLLESGQILTDYFWSDEDYKGFIEAAGLTNLMSRKAIGKSDDGIRWLDETHTAPYVIYVGRRDF